MEIAEQSKLKFLGVEIVNIQYNVTERIPPGTTLSLSVIPKVHIPDDNPLAFTVVMTVELKYEDKFNLTVIAAGNFLIEGIENNNEDLRKSFINANSPAIMFPYLRAFISVLTSNLGGIINPVIIPPQFFNGELEILEEQQKETVVTN